MNMKRFLAIALSLCMLLSVMPMGAFATENETLEVSDLLIEELDGNDYDVNLTKENIESENVVEGQTFEDDETVKVIIVMEEASVVESDAAAVLNDETIEQTEQLQASQAEIVSEIEETVLDGETLDVNYNYTWLLNGISAQVPYGTISAISEVKGVKQVLLQRSYQVCENEVTASDILTNNDGVMIGRESTWAEGYTGEGMTIAIIDTGLDIDHQNFQALDEEIETAVSADDVSAVLGSLHASELYSGLALEDVYYSSKVVFGFNYSDNNINITHDYDSQSDHGTHVAGIAAANKVEGSEAVGVAPDAQLMVMKVFGENGGAYDDDILAALEDAMKLGADVINLSLGSPAGFTTSEWVDMAEFYDRVADTDIVLTISAGNNYDSGYANNWGTDANQTINPDNAVVGSPGTYANVLSVASVENVAYLANYIDADGYRIGYLDSASTYGHEDLISLTGEYQIVAVPGAGDVADYEDLDVTGKLALVQRGSINFSAKCDNAADAGAVACIVYNNTSGDFGMDLSGGESTIPCVSITMANGSYLISALEENPGLTVSFPAEEAEVANENAYDMSDFSSWGPAPDLSLEPDITAPGGNIYSTLTDGGYGVMSGTSMAAPNLAGMSALVMQYVKANFDETADYRTLVRDLLMSTSVPLVDDETGLTYSPRKQGSGLANVYSAVATQAYLTVDGSDTAKAELGDDDNRTGVYNYTFDVHNFGKTALFYALNTTAQTEDVISYGNGGDGLDFMSGTPTALSAATSNSSNAMVLTHDVDEDGATGSHDAYWIYQTVQGTPMDENWNEVAFRYDTDCDDGVDEADVQAYLDALVGNESAADLEDTVLKVDSGATVAVDVNVTLSAEDKAYFDFYYTNGGYVEGYTYLTAKNAGSVDLSLPYLGFYGDWADAPVLDEKVYFWDTLNNGAVGSQYFHALLTEYGDMGEYYLGYNLYVEDTVDPAHISVSPDGNGYVDDVSDIYVSLMRNAAQMTVSYTDVSTDEVYYKHTIQNAPKSCYSSANGMVIPFIYSWYADEVLYDMADLPNNTALNVTVEVVGVAENDEPETISFPVTVDLEAPALTGAKKLVDLDTGARYLELSFSENVSAAAVGLLSADGNELYYLQGVEDVAEDENGYQNYTVTFDVTEVSDKVMLVLADYALNEAYYGLNLNGEGASYGDLVAYQYNFTTGTNEWVSFDADVNADETALFLGDTDIICAEYVNGFVFAQTEDGKLYGFPYEDMLNDTLDLESTYVAQLDNVYQDLAYSYAEGKLYGLFVYEDDGYPTSELYSININGEYYDENLWATVAPYQEDWMVSRGGLYGLTMAIDDAGTVYVLGHNYTNSYDENDEPVVNISETAHLWSVGLEYDEWSESYMMGYLMTDLGDVGMSMDYLQSMTWDHNAEKLYWARFDAVGLDLVSELVEITVGTDEEGAATVSATKVGTLSGETCALFAPLSDVSAAKEEHANVPAMDTSVIGTPILRDSVITMNVTAVKALSYDMDPWYTEHKSVVWSSSNESVAAVDANGYVTAVGTGSATITVANAEDETKFDTVTVEVTALDLVIEGVVSAQTAGVGSTTGTSTYKFEMVDGLAEFGTVNAITASEELNYGLSLATSVMGRGSIWASEYGNTGMIYQINAGTGEVKDVLQPVDGDMLFGMTYNDELDTFAGIMNMYLYVDLALTHEEEKEMQDSYDEELNEFMYHKVNMLPYLEESNTGFATGETGQGASSEIVFSGITTLPGGYYFEDTSKDYLGNWDMSGNMVTYTADQTLLLMDNVGRLWYIDEVTGMTKTPEDEYGNVEYSNEDGSAYITCYGEFRNGVFAVETGDGVYSLFNIRCIDETDLTDMFRDGNMPRITYHFSDIKYAGDTADGAPMIIMSLYDYWNEGTTNELYLYIPGVGTGEWVMDYDTWMSYEVKTPTRLYKLGDTGENNIIASVHFAEVTGGIDLVSSEEELAERTMEELGVNTLMVAAYSKTK